MRVCGENLLSIFKPEISHQNFGRICFCCFIKILLIEQTCWDTNVLTLNKLYLMPPQTIKYVFQFWRNSEENVCFVKNTKTYIFQLISFSCHIAIAEKNKRLLLFLYYYIPCLRKLDTFRVIIQNKISRKKSKGYVCIPMKIWWKFHHLGMRWKLMPKCFDATRTRIWTQFYDYNYTKHYLTHDG